MIKDTKITRTMLRIIRCSLCVVAFLLCCSAAGQDKERPNIIIFLADDLGYNDLSCYRKHNEQISEQASTSRTPNIDDLAENGLRFTDFYCGAAVCSPSRAALITGRNCTRVGIYNWIPPNQPMHLRREEITIAELLKEKGYLTGHFGKWHLTSEHMGQPIPNDQGYDYSYYTYNNAHPSHRNPDNFFVNGQADEEEPGYSCDLVVNEAISWLSRVHSSEEPFYMNVWFNEPHSKVAAPEKFSSRHHYNKEYYGCIENMDQAVGRLLVFLEKIEAHENTLIIFSSDNGSPKQGSNDPFRARKAFNFEGGVRVPFILSWPGHVPAGVTSGAAGSFTDVMPTLAAVAGAPLPDDRKYDGIDLGDHLRDSRAAIERAEPIFFFRYFHEPVCMLREGDWVLLGFNEPMPFQRFYDTRDYAKLKPGQGDPSWSQWGFQEGHMDYLSGLDLVHFELYNVRDDPGQTKDLSASYPELVDRLKPVMLRLKEEMISEGGNWYN